MIACVCVITPGVRMIFESLFLHDRRDVGESLDVCIEVV